MENTITETPIIQSNHVNTSIYRWVNDDRNVSHGSLDSCPEVQREGIGQSGNYIIGMNPPVTIKRNIPQNTRRGSSNYLTLSKRISNLANNNMSWHGAEINENCAHDTLKKRWVQEYFDVENMDAKILKFSLKLICRIKSSRLNSLQLNLCWIGQNKINTIWPSLVHYIESFCGDHMIYALVTFMQQHKPVHFLQEQLWHIITHNQYIQTLRYP